MTLSQPPDVPKWALAILNNLYEVEQKLSNGGDPSNVLRNVQKMKDVMGDIGLFYEDPMDQPFKETRTDLEATISGSETENLRVVQVFKPIIRSGQESYSRVIQKGIVIVESKTTIK